MAYDALRRFLKYVTIFTTSKEGEETIPSTQRQFDLAKLLMKELHEIGITDAIVTKNCYVIGTLKSNLSVPEAEKVPVLCLLAHMDTSPEEPGENVKPRVIENYQGGEIRYPANPDLVLSPDDTPSLSKFIGTDIVTSDGTTLLGADNKAGIAAIMSAMNYLQANPKLRHGVVKIVFTPDEEVGRGYVPRLHRSSTPDLRALRSVANRTHQAR